jgi:hypothetical protein
VCGIALVALVAVISTNVDAGKEGRDDGTTSLRSSKVLGGVEVVLRNISHSYVKRIYFVHYFASMLARSIFVSRR